MEEDKTVIECSNITRTFLDGPREIQVLRDVSFGVGRAEMVSIIGPSGSGKTTLLNIIACLDRPTSGKVYIEDVDATRLSDEDLSGIRSRKIGMVFQDFFLMPDLSVAENAEVPLIFDSVPQAKRRRRVAEMLSLLGLSDRAHFRPAELSSGEQQMVAIARALANDPVIILADEPTGNLDTMSGTKIVELLRSLTKTQNKSVLLCTHDLEAAKKADRILRLKTGVVQAVEKRDLS